MRHVRQTVKQIRKALYWPLEHLSELPGGPLRYMWLMRLVVKLDGPFRRYLLGGRYESKTTT